MLLLINIIEWLCQKQRILYKDKKRVRQFYTHWYHGTDLPVNSMQT